MTFDIYSCSLSCWGDKRGALALRDFFHMRNDSHRGFIHVFFFSKSFHPQRISCPSHCGGFFGENTVTQARRHSAIFMCTFRCENHAHWSDITGETFCRGNFFWFGLLAYVLVLKIEVEEVRFSAQQEAELFGTEGTVVIGSGWKDHTHIFLCIYLDQQYSNWQIVVIVF